MAEHDSRIRFFPKSNGGIGSACNHMLSFAKGEYALQLDGDDVLAPDTVEKMVQIWIILQLDSFMGMPFWLIEI